MNSFNGAETQAQEKKKISIRSLIEDLGNGVTRCEGDTGYDPQRGSIQEKYDLSKTDVKKIFQHPKLKGLKVRIPQEESFELIDDVDEEEIITSARFGERSVSSHTRAEEAKPAVQQTITPQGELNINSHISQTL